MPSIKAAIIAPDTKLAAELHSSLENIPVEIALEESNIEKAEAALEGTPGVRLLFLDFSETQTALALIRRVKPAMPGLAVFALHRTADPHAILDALRAGVSEYLVPPFRPTLQTALDRLSATDAGDTTGVPLRTGGRVLGFLSAKGGCGATTIACHLARELPKLTGTKALLTDCDFDAGLVSFVFKTKSAYSLADAAMNVHRLDASYWKAVVNNGVPGLDMIGAVPGGNTQAMTPEHLEKVFAFLKDQYSWVLVDVGRGLNMFRMSILTNCDDIYVVSTVEITALHHAQRTVTRLIESGFPSQRLHILLNRPPKQMDVSLAELEKMLGAEILVTIPNDDEVLSESYAEGKLASPSTAIGRAVTELGRKVAGMQIEKQQKKRFSLFR